MPEKPIYLPRRNALPGVPIPTVTRGPVALSNQMAALTGGLPPGLASCWTLGNKSLPATEPGSRPTTSTVFLPVCVVCIACGTPKSCFVSTKKVAITSATSAHETSLLCTSALFAKTQRLQWTKYSQKVTFNRNRTCAQENGCTFRQARESRFHSLS